MRTACRQCAGVVLAAPLRLAVPRHAGGDGVFFMLFLAGADVLRIEGHVGLLSGGLAAAAGLEPAVSGPKPDALPLGYAAVWWSQRGLNPQPAACNAAALPVELWPHVVGAAGIEPAATCAQGRCATAAPRSVHRLLVPVCAWNLSSVNYAIMSRKTSAIYANFF